MKCRIKKINNNLYFHSHLGFECMPNHWVIRQESKLFGSVADARKIIKDYKLKGVEIDKNE